MVFISQIVCMDVQEDDWSDADSFVAIATDIIHIWSKCFLGNTYLFLLVSPFAIWQPALDKEKHNMSTIQPVHKLLHHPTRNVLVAAYGNQLLIVDSK